MAERRCVWTTCVMHMCRRVTPFLSLHVKCACVDQPAQCIVQTGPRMHTLHFVYLITGFKDTPHSTEIQIYCKFA